MSRGAGSRDGEPGPAGVFPMIVGSGRSGTTLLRAMLDAHPDLAIPPESHFLTRLERRRGRYERAEGFALDALVEDLGHERRFLAWGVDPEALRRSLTEAAPRDLPEAVRAVYRAYARAEGKSRFGDKTPNYVASLPELAELLPDARFVHIVRDGRNATLSYLERDFGPDSVVAGALRWRRLVSAGRAAGTKLGPERYLEVRYEDLVEAPEAGLRRICAFLVLPYDPAMTAYHDHADGVLRALDRSDHRGLELPPTKDMRDWRTAMAPADRWAFDAIAGELLEELGYERGSAPGEHPPASEAERLFHELLAEAERLSAQSERHSERRRELQARSAKLEQRRPDASRLRDLGARAGRLVRGRGGRATA